MFSICVLVMLLLCSASLAAEEARIGYCQQYAQVPAGAKTGATPVSACRYESSTCPEGVDGNQDAIRAYKPAMANKSCSDFYPKPRGTGSWTNIKLCQPPSTKLLFSSSTYINKKTHAIKRRIFNTMPRRVAFADGPEIAVCLETGESVAPRSTHEFSRDLFLERANDKAATEAAVKMLADKMARLRLEDSPDVEMYDVANACQEDADADADAYGADGSSLAGSEDPSFAKQDKTVRRRVQDAENRALRLSARAVTNGWLDFALYVCRTGSRMHKNLLALQVKYGDSGRIGSYGGDEMSFAISGGKGVVSQLPWYTDYTTAMSAERTWEVLVGE
ncbi:hypothetical protein VFPFJ_10179 [Purpureocillium lilacinum]|uniref:Uncharacterized protein n=1 Tax=Purpureocillium lilacinum TaxID=33203 RepID=A0A179GJU9_PURLI|nr:hypothetical protein VFPFJ_10179 [Purpureocillium lilacinum]OAQ78147.1 hypothetical protein VFPFJ_10179 [Purpureocillium lilacinum]